MQLIVCQRIRREHRRVPAGLVVIQAAQTGLERPLAGVVAIGGSGHGLLRAGHRPRLAKAGAQRGRHGRGRGRVPGRAERGLVPRLGKGPRGRGHQAAAAEMILVQVLHRGHRGRRLRGRGGDGYAPAAEGGILARGAAGRVLLIQAPGGIAGHGAPGHLVGHQRPATIVDEAAGGTAGHRHAGLVPLHVVAVRVARVALGAGAHGAVGVVGVGVGVSAAGRRGHGQRPLLRGRCLQLERCGRPRSAPRPGLRPPQSTNRMGAQDNRLTTNSRSSPYTRCEITT